MTPKRINHIEIIEEIGSGGTASVLKGVDLNNGRLVAVKVLWSNLFKSDEIKKRFIFEANQYLYLNHPGIVALKDFIIKDDAYYLVMEYIEGQNLDEYINKVTGPMPENKAISTMLEILEAVGYAHKNNVLHLDIKPANIMIDGNSKIKLLDFGISSEGQQANNGQIMGSPLYMSPEQITGKNIDKPSDIYSLGITFFQMLTGKTPYTGNMSREELFAKIQEGNLPKAKSIYPFVTDKIQSIIDNATNTDRTKRFQSTDEFSSQLKAI
jgi:serine/threonine-protein kinase